jgi:flavin-dependent dehydrogenase
MGRIREVLDTPVLDEVDVLVCGGGMTGFPAALAAARNGASTILLESEGSLGGTATAGLMSGYAPYFGDGLGSQIVGGIIIEFTERLEGEDALPADAFTSSGGHCKLQFDPEVFKRVAMDMVREAGVEVILNGHARSPLMEDGQVLGVSFQTRMGGFAIRAKTTVDATGDGSIAAWAGAPSRKQAIPPPHLCTVSVTSIWTERPRQCPPVCQRGRLQTSWTGTTGTGRFLW